MTNVRRGGKEVKRLTNSSANPLAGHARPIGDLLREAHQVLVAHLDDALREAGWPRVRAPHASVLATVDLDGTRLATMVERAGRTKQATAELAGHLVTCGYLELRGDPTDRRAKLYVPTEQGVALLASCAEVVAAYETWLDGVLGPGTVGELRTTLTAIVDRPPR